MIHSNLSHRLAVQSYINNCQTPSMAPCGPAGNAASFPATAYNYLYCPNNSSLQLNGTSWNYSFWMKPTAVSGGVQYVLTKADDQGSVAFQFGSNVGYLMLVCRNADNTNYSQLQTSTTIDDDVWHFVNIWHDGSTLFMQIDNGTIYNIALNGTMLETNPLRLGTRTDVESNWYAYDGSIQNVGFWKRTLTAEERTALYNSGTGRSYSSLDSSLKRNLVSWWALNETSGSRLDSHSVNHLIDNNTVGYTTGIVPEVWHNPRTALMNWADGIVDVGGSALWNYMACYPLIKGQNKGSGTVAYSLGGLGSYNGTIAGNPVWDVIGINRSAYSMGITTTLSLPTGNSSRTLIGVASNNDSSTFPIIGSTPVDGNRFVLKIESWQACSADLYAINAAFANTSVPSGLSISAISYNAPTTTVTHKANSLTPTSAVIEARNFASSTITFGGWNTIENYGLGTISFGAAFNCSVNGSDMALIFSLYKETLGIGLNLP